MTWIELDGACNARDLGGLPTVDGRVTRTGVLLRADNLQDLTTRDVEELSRRGLGTVLDLRTTSEIELLGPGPLHGTPVKHLHLDLIPHGFEGRSVLERTIPDENAPEHAVDHLYFDYVRDAPDAFATALRTIADPNSGAVLVHCAAGKDRTGTVVGLALSVAGVADEDVVADYVATGERIERVVERLRARPAYNEALEDQPMEHHRPRPETMARILTVLAERHGGAAGWLREQGWDDEQVGRLRKRLRA